MSAAVRLFSGLAVQGAVEGTVLPRFRELYDAEVETTFEPTSVLVDLLREGARTDLVIAVEEAVGDLGARGLVKSDSSRRLVRVGLGLAVPAATPIPQIESLPAFVRVLTEARSVAYSQAGASGIYFARLLDRLGIGETVNSKATVIPKGYTGECLLDGRADVAIQQLSELRSVEGIQVAGPFPPRVQHYTVLAMANTSSDEGDAQLVDGLRILLTDAPAQAAYSEAGMEPYGSS